MSDEVRRPNRSGRLYDTTKRLTQIAIAGSIGAVIGGLIFAVVAGIWLWVMP